MSVAARARLAPVLREPEFLKLFTGQLISNLGDGIVPVVLPFAVLALGGGAAQVGAVLAAGWVPIVALILVGGVIGDRFPRRHVMIAADVLRMGAQGTAAALLVSGHAQIWELGALQVAWGVGAAFFNPAAGALVPQVVSEPNLQAANGLSRLSTSLSSVVGPALGGILVVATSPGWAFAFDSATFAGSVVSLLLLRPPREVARPPGAAFGIVAQLREGWDEFRSRDWLWPTVAQATVFNLAVLAPILVLGPVIARARLGGPGAWAALAASFGVGSVLGGLLAMRVRPARPVLAAVALLLPYCVPPMLLALAVPAPVTAVAVGVAGFGLSVSTTLMRTAIQLAVPPQALGRVMSYTFLGGVACLPVGLAAAGGVAAAVGPSTTLVGSAVLWLVLTCAVLAAPGVRRFRWPAGAAA